jgi:hypothetical protein
MPLTAINHGAWLLVTARLTAVNIGAVASAGQPISYTPGLHLVGCELDEAELARLRLELQRCRDNGGVAQLRSHRSATQGE